MEVGAPRGLQSPSLWGFSVPIPVGFLHPHPIWSLHPQGDTGTGAPHTLGSDVPREHGAVQCHPPGSVPSPTTSAPTSPRWHRGLTCCAVGWAMGAAAVSEARSRGLCELCWVSSGLFWVWGFAGSAGWQRGALCLMGQSCSATLLTPGPSGAAKRVLFSCQFGVRMMDVHLVFSGAAPPRLRVGSAPTPQPHPTAAPYWDPMRGQTPLGTPGVADPPPSGLRFPTPFLPQQWDWGSPHPPHRTTPQRGLRWDPHEGTKPHWGPPGSVPSTLPCCVPPPLSFPSNGSEGDPIYPIAPPHTGDHSGTHPWRGQNPIGDLRDRCPPPHSWGHDGTPTRAQTPLEPHRSGVTPPSPPPAVGWGYLHPSTPQHRPEP